MPAEPVVHVVDDDESVRLALSSLFRSIGLRVSLYSSATEFIGSPRSLEPGCVISDVRMPGMGGLEFQERLASSGTGYPIILITAHGDVPMTVRAMKAGATDFLCKPFREQDVIDAVMAALKLAGERRSATDSEAALRARFGTLTARERQVMTLVASGRLNKEVAGALQLSEITVKIHRSRAMRKMEARTLPDLVRMSDLCSRIQEVDNTTV